MRASAGGRRRARAIGVLLFSLICLCWYHAYRIATPVDPRSAIRLTGEPAAVVSFAGQVIVATAAGDVSAFEPISGRRLILKRRLAHTVRSLAVLGSSLYALGDGQITRLGPTLKVLAQRRLPGHADLLAAGPAGLWAAGAAGSVVRIDPGTLKTNARVPVRGRVGGLAVSTSSVWVSVTSESQLLVVRRGLDRRFVVRQRTATAREPGPVVIAGDTAWVLCKTELAGYALTDLRLTRSRRVGAAATMLATANKRLYVGSPRTGAVTQYGVEKLELVGTPISVAGLPSSMMVDLHAVWVTRVEDFSLLRLDLAGLAAQRRHARRDAPLGVHPKVYAGVLTMVLLQAALAWRSSDPNAGLPRHELGDICLVAVDDVRWMPLSDGRVDSSVRSKVLHRGIVLGAGGRALDVGQDSGLTDTLSDLPREHGVRHALERLLRSGQVKRFLAYAPSAGAWLRTRSSIRLGPERVRRRFLALEPHSICLLSGTFAVSWPNPDTVQLQLPQLLDRSWGRWQRYDVAREAWLTVECASATLTLLGRCELTRHVSEITLSVLAVPAPRREGETSLRLQLLLAYYEPSI